jgi:hypothetical protein
VRFLRVVLSYGSFPFSSLVLPQPPVTQAVGRLDKTQNRNMQVDRSNKGKIQWNQKDLPYRNH